MRKALALLLIALPTPALAMQSVAVASTSGAHGRSSVMVTVPFGRTVRLNHLVLRPMAIVADSRCPAEVQCVWAGELVVDFETRKGEKIRLTMGQPQAIAGGKLTLLSAMPRKSRTGSISPRSYVFTLKFERS